MAKCSKKKKTNLTPSPIQATSGDGGAVETLVPAAPLRVWGYGDPTVPKETPEDKVPGLRCCCQISSSPAVFLPFPLRSWLLELSPTWQRLCPGETHSHWRVGSAEGQLCLHSSAASEEQPHSLLPNRSGVPLEETLAAVLLLVACGRAFPTAQGRAERDKL